MVSSALNCGLMPFRKQPLRGVLRFLASRFPKERRDLGDWVLVKRQQPEAFGDRTVSAVYLGHDDSTVGGAWVLQQQQDNTVITRARLPMLDNKKRARWKRSFTPGGESVWTSTIGDVAFADLPPEDRDGDVNILTLEERLDGPADSGS